MTGLQGLFSVFQKATGALFGFGKSVLSATSNFEMITNGFSNVMKNLGATSEQTDKMTESLRKFAVETTFSYDTLVSASQQLLTVGVNMDSIQDKLMQLGNISGGSTEKFQRLIEIYTKVKALGKAGAIQIQQLSMLTGVSFVNALGKTNATAEELDELFAKLTSDGGMFEGTMASLNNTLTGKLDFVTDTWQEFLSQLGMVSGVADMAKAALDVVYNVLQGIVDWLHKLNDNPIMKAIMQGVLVGLLAGIATFLAGTFVSALMAVKTALMAVGGVATAISSIPIVAIIAGIAAAVAGLVVGITALVNYKQDKFVNDENSIELQRQNDLLREQLGLSKELTDEDIFQELGDLEKNGAYSISDKHKYYMDKIYQKSHEMYGIEASASNAWADWLDFNGYGRGEYSFDKWLNSEYSSDDYKEQIDAYKEEIKQLYKEKKTYDDILDRQKQQLELQNKLNESQEQYNASLETVNGVLENLGDKNKQELTSYTEQMKALEEMYNQTKIVESKSGFLPTSAGGEFKILQTEKKIVDLDPQFKSKLDEAMNLVQKKVGDLELEININSAKSGMSDYQRFLADLAGIDDSQLLQYAKVDHTEQYTNQNGVVKSKNIYKEDANGNIKLYIGTQTALNKILESNSLISLGKKYASIAKSGDTKRNYENRKLKGTEDYNLKNIFGYDETALLENKVNSLYDGLQAIVDYADVASKTGYVTNEDGSKTWYEEGQLMINQDAYKEWYETYMKAKTELDTAKYNDIFTQLFENAEGFNVKANLYGWTGEEYDSEYKSMLQDSLKLVENAIEGGLASGMSEERLKLLVDKAKDLKNALEENTETLRQFKTLEEVSEYLQGLYQNALEGTEDYAGSSFWERMKAMIGTSIGNQVVSAAQGTDAGNFVEGTLMSGNAGLGALHMLISAILEVVNEIDGIDYILSPIKEAIENFTPIIKTVLYYLSFVTQILAKATSWLMNLLDALTGGFFTRMSGIYDELVESNSKDTTEELIEKLKELKEAIIEENENYKEQKRSLNAQTAMSVTPVNDMILTDKGIFSTHPQDTIMAMKNPASLVNEASSVNVTINNNSGANVDVQKKVNSDGMTELVVNISRKIAQDYAKGVNGWDSAYSNQQSRLNGRRISI